MLLRTHILFSFIIGLFIFNKPILFGFLFIATIMPDLDMQIPFVKHRGFFHSILVGFLLSLVFVPYSMMVGLAFFIGFCSHLLADSFTVSGVTPFWPFSRYKTDFGLITTGKFSEEIFSFALLFILAMKLLSIVL